MGRDVVESRLGSVDRRRLGGRCRKRMTVSEGKKDGSAHGSVKEAGRS